MIYFVRHGETDYNVAGIAQGQLDIPLNEKGIKQAETLSNILKDYELDIIVCSPLIRAKITAEIINKHHNVPIIFEERFKEFFAGKRQGTKSSEWDEEKNKDFMLNPEKYGAESNEGFYKRCIDAYKDLPKNKNVLVVSHAGVYKNILRFKQNSTFDTYFNIPDNCQILDIT